MGNNTEDVVIKYIKRKRETGKIEFKESYCLFNSENKLIKACKAELIKDVMSLANAESDPEEETGFLIIGVNDNGIITNNYKAMVEDPSDLDGIINSLLERPIIFHYKEINNEDKKIGVIIIPKSNARPHVIKSDFHNDDRSILLKKGECWTRSGVGGKRIALAQDYDLIYEEKSNKRVEEATNAQAKVIAELHKKERSLRKRKISEKIDTPEIIFSLDSEKFNVNIRRLLRGK